MDPHLLQKKIADDTREILLLLESFGRDHKRQKDDVELAKKAQLDTLGHARNAEENSLKAAHKAEASEASSQRARLAAERMEIVVGHLRDELRDAMGVVSDLQLAIDVANKRAEQFEEKVLGMLGQVVSGQENLMRDFVEPAKTQVDGSAVEAPPVATSEPA